VGLLFKNNAETTLSSGINDAVTTVPVTSAAVFPTPNANNVFFATIDDGTNIETVKVTAISSNDLTVVRAQDNTSAAAFGSGAKIELRLNAKVLEMGTSSITDLDGDTAIFVEQLDDEDKIRMDTGGNQRVLINSSGLEISSGNLSNASGDLTIDCPADIILDADGEHIRFKDNGTEWGNIESGSLNFNLTVSQQDKDFVFLGNDGGTGIEALRLDMSEAGKAIFKSNEIEFDNSSNSTQVATIAINDPGNNAGKYLRLKGHSAVRLEGNQTEFYDNGGPLFMVVSGGVSGTSPAFSATAASNTNFTFKTSSGGSQTIAFTIASSGITAAGNVTAFSDVRLKHDIKTIEGGLEIVEKLRGVTYKRKDTEKDKENIGVIAQEVEEILPQIVNTANDEMGTKSVDYGKITSVLIEAVKELSARVKELEDK
jgi:hypothetical protein